MIARTQQPSRQPHRNERLFSDHYFDMTLPEWPERKTLLERVVTGEGSGVKTVSLEVASFAQEAHKCRPKSVDRLTFAALKNLRVGYEGQAILVREARTEVARLERNLSDLVNEEYGIIVEESTLPWFTAPPRMPGLRG